MRERFLTVSLLGLCFSISACTFNTTASSPALTHSSVPSNRIVHLPPLEESPTHAKIIVMRDSQFQGSIMTTTLTIGGKDAAHIRSGEKVIFSLPAGEHLLGLKYLGNDPVMGWLTLGLARPERFVENPLSVEGGKEYIYRIVDNANWEWELRRFSK